MSEKNFLDKLAELNNDNTHNTSTDEMIKSEKGSEKDWKEFDKTKFKTVELENIKKNLIRFQKRTAGHQDYVKGEGMFTILMKDETNHLILLGKLSTVQTLELRKALKTAIKQLDDTLEQYGL